jgi:hypothetical protein
VGGAGHSPRDESPAAALVTRPAGLARRLRLLGGHDFRRGLRRRGRHRFRVDDPALENLNHVGGLDLLPADHEHADERGVLREAVCQLLVGGHP